MLLETTCEQNDAFILLRCIEFSRVPATVFVSLRALTVNKNHNQTQIAVPTGKPARSQPSLVGQGNVLLNVTDAVCSLSP